MLLVLPLKPVRLSIAAAVLASFSSLRRSASIPAATTRALYLINRYIPMASTIKTILNVVVVVVICVWLLQAAGLWERKPLSVYAITVAPKRKLTIFGRMTSHGRVRHRIARTL